MKTFQFTYSQGEILTLAQLAESTKLGISNNKYLRVENKEGIYFHGKVNASSEKEANERLQYYFHKVYPLEVAQSIIPKSCC